MCIQYVDAEPGDFILAHAGMAITRLDSEEAEATLEDFKILADNLNPDNHVV
uniref:HypC/HybG/HupF family hydrogenase formation chaperone n=1 Tax=Barnesiella intestinihominis TaxID=487174 RepID=UPI003FF0F8C7